jgi:hypothetical protein
MHTKYHKTEIEFYSWLAGLIDGDGCLSISLHFDGKHLHIGFAVCIGLKKNYDFVIEYIKENAMLGQIYYSNKGKDNEVVRWQTSNLADSIEIVEKVLPFLILKKEKALRFLECANWYKSTCTRVKGKRNLGTRIRTNAEMKNAIKVSIELNYDRQTKRYREKKGLNYWNMLIDQMYPNEVLSKI